MMGSRETMRAFNPVMHEEARHVMRWSFSRYVSVGAIATVVHYLVLVTLVELAHAEPGTAAAAGAVCGAVTAYIMNARYTFVTKCLHRYSLPRFMLVAALAAGANGLLVHLGTAVLHWHYGSVQMATTLLLVVITYQCNRRWSFS